ncbi:hypothetical protein O3597_03625 [Verrucosispora sp. WMMA2044]|uniref:Uncharacterized protein n=1 Tax=Verrucosispora sioxanthis TaxID=2499994 RepID=A0A6M1LBL6_9ACTN|nr:MULTISPECIES: hypothetical protein [Micromonospora]NEE66461.1 hypothetical protein [Verrucosispora sioxanthis]NGM15571.1 hypothetical protein [Verrucosispora sioxanthis]WBB49594.1 hypothetical protein O3597_03625 [Verrucosispora sp. WMMA2044]
MPAKRSSRKSRPDRQSAELAAVTPANLDDVAITPVPTLPTGRPAAPKAGPPATGTSGVGRGQRTGQVRRYAFRRS